MKVVSVLVVVVHVIFSLGLIASVLMQSGRSAGLSGAVAGAGQQLFGKKKGIDELFARLTTISAVGFMLSALALTVLHG